MVKRKAIYSVKKLRWTTKTLPLDFFQSHIAADNKWIIYKGKSPFKLGSNFFWTFKYKKDALWNAKRLNIKK